jgi:hypothetical protein
LTVEQKRSECHVIYNLYLCHCSAGCSTLDQVGGGAQIADRDADRERDPRGHFCHWPAAARLVQSKRSIWYVHWRMKPAHRFCDSKLENVRGIRNLERSQRLALRWANRDVTVRHVSCRQGDEVFGLACSLLRHARCYLQRSHRRKTPKR